MTDARLYRQSAEVLASTDPDARLYRQSVEVLADTDPDVRLNRLAVDALAAGTPVLRLDRHAVDVLANATPTLRLDRHAVNVLADAIPTIRLDRQAVDVLHGPPSDWIVSEFTTPSEFVLQIGVEAWTLTGGTFTATRASSVSDANPARSPLMMRFDTASVIPEDATIVRVIVTAYVSSSNDGRVSSRPFQASIGRFMVGSPGYVGMYTYEQCVLAGITAGMLASPDFCIQFRPTPTGTVTTYLNSFKLTVIWKDDHGDPDPVLYRELYPTAVTETTNASAYGASANLLDASYLTRASGIYLSGAPYYWNLDFTVPVWDYLTGLDDLIEIQSQHFLQQEAAYSSNMVRYLNGAETGGDTAIALGYLALTYELNVVLPYTLDQLLDTDVRLRFRVNKSIVNTHRHILHDLRFLLKYTRQSMSVDYIPI